MSIKKRGLSLFVMVFVAIAMIFSAGIANAETMTIKTKSGNKIVTYTPETEEAAKAIEIINTNRASKGLTRLQRDATLDQYALTRAVEQSEQFSHVRPDGTKWSTVFDPMKWSTLGENLANGGRLAQTIVRAWDNSIDHANNQYSGTKFAKRYTKIGIAHVKIDNRFYWATTFGLPQPGTPKGIKVKKSGKKVKVSWKKSNNAVGYQVSQAVSSKGVKSKGHATGLSKRVSAKKGKKYYYKVRAYIKGADGSKVYGQWSKKVRYAR